MTKTKKKTVEDWLNSVDYSYDPNYIPSEFALNYVNFIKLVNGSDGESHKTPVVHYKMLDLLPGSTVRLANLCSRGFGKALALNEEVYTDKGISTIGSIQVGDWIYGEDGKLTQILGKSEVFHKPMYRINLVDGRSIKVSEDHINVVIHKRKVRYGAKSVTEYQRRDLTTKELLKYSITTNRKVTKKNPKGREHNFWVPTCDPIMYSYKQLEVDPYTLGILLGDGRIQKETGYPTFTCHKDDLSHYINKIPYHLGRISYDKRNLNVATIGIRNIGKFLKELKLNVHSDFKFIPEHYLYSSLDQRLELLKGLMDSDGTITKQGCISFCSNSSELRKGVISLVRSLGGIATESGLNVNIKINLSIFSLHRKKERENTISVSKVAIDSVEKIPTEPSQCLYVDNHLHTFLTTDYTVTHNTVLFGEYLILYIAVFGEIDGFGDITGMIYVSDSIENGVKSLRKNIEHRYNNSDFLKKYLPEVRFTDVFMEFTNASGHKLGVRSFGAKALSLDTVIYTPTGASTIGECKVGDTIIGSDGRPTNIIAKSELFHKPMYRITLSDGRFKDVSEDHLNQIHVKQFKGIGNKHEYKEITISTKHLLQMDMFRIASKGHKNPLLFIENNKPVQFKENTDLLIDPYTVGVLIGDGSLNQKITNRVPVVLTAHEDDWPTYEEYIPYELGKVYRDKRNPTTICRTVKGINIFISAHGLSTHGDVKKVPNEYKYGSIEQRLSLLQGLMDTDGSAYKNGKCAFSSNSLQLVKDVMWLVRSLGGEARFTKTGKLTHYRTSVKLDMPLFRLNRKLERQGKIRNNKMSIVSISPIDLVPSQCIAVDNEDKQFLVNDFIRTHNTGLRGTKIYGKRPTLAVLDDLVSDDDARSSTVMNAIKDTVYKGVDYALDPTKRKIVFSGTPFNKSDILYEAVESGGWHVNVFPICEKFPCSKEEFKGAWEDRFSYKFVKDQYDVAIATGQIASFDQELMLRIMSDDDRLIQDSSIIWYKRSLVLANRDMFNFYITTDFATSEKSSADFSVISVWAYSSNGDWLWVDGVVKRQLMGANINDLFRLAQEYSPQSVGIEVSGQQGGFISWIQEQMISRNCYFNLASEGNSNKPGIRPNTNKMVRFNTVVPLFNLHKIWFPEDLKDDPRIMEFMEELRLASPNGFQSKNDDCIDTISMLSLLNPWKPSTEAPSSDPSKNSMWEDENSPIISNLDSYII